MKCVTARQKDLGFIEAALQSGNRTRELKYDVIIPYITWLGGEQRPLSRLYMDTKKSIKKKEKGKRLEWEIKGNQINRGAPFLHFHSEAKNTNP